MSDSSVPSFYVGAQNRGSTPGPYACTAGTLLTELRPSHQFLTYLPFSLSRWSCCDRQTVPDFGNESLLSYLLRPCVITLKGWLGLGCEP